VLEINNLGEGENGYYYCTVSNENGPADQQRSSIRVIRKYFPLLKKTKTL